MPTYDYSCRACDRTFEVHLSLKEHSVHQVQCAHCHSAQVEQAVTHGFHPLDRRWGGSLGVGHRTRALILWTASSVEAAHTSA